jgi:hypothetical protein
VTRDTVDELCLRITTSWPRTRREIPSETGANIGKKRKEADWGGSDEVPIVCSNAPTVTATEDAGGNGAHVLSCTRENDDVHQTKWAYLEFEDEKRVSLHNSVSTSFHIGSIPSVKQHYHQFYHEDVNICGSISRAHCHIVRLDTGAFHLLFGL